MFAFLLSPYERAEKEKLSDVFYFAWKGPQRSVAVCIPFLYSLYSGVCCNGGVGGWCLVVQQLVMVIMEMEG